MAAKKRKQAVSRKQAAEQLGRQSTGESTAQSTERSTAQSSAQARVFPLAALRAALGTEVDRIRKYGGYTLILRRGRPVAAVVPYEEFERLAMMDRRTDRRTDRTNRKGSGKNGNAPKHMTPTELMAEIEGIRAAIAEDWAKNGRPPDSKLSTADLIRKNREERTDQILGAGRAGSTRRKRSRGTRGS